MTDTITLPRATVQQALDAMEDLGMRHFENTGEKLYADIYIALRTALEQQAEPVAAESITDAMMNLVDRLGSEWKQVDLRAWQHLLVYAPQQQAEPVAYIHRQGNHWEVSERFLLDDEKARGWTEEPIYTRPPQRKPLTDEEIDAGVKAWFKNPIVAGRQPFAKRMRAAIEASHSIKEGT